MRRPLQPQEAYEYVVARLHNKVIPFSTSTSLAVLDAEAMTVLSAQMRVVAHFKLERLSEADADAVIRVGWEVFVGHCEGDQTWRHVDALFDLCIETAKVRLGMEPSSHPQ